MNVLVVDDQTSVVSGLISGIHWEALGITNIFPAYNAFEAKKILDEKVIDIILCDIEMPAENGLSLLRWAKRNGFSGECIFLTSHADFHYSTEVIRLGGFDYILQPVRYEAVEKSMIRAIEKMKMEKEQSKMSSYGKFLKLNKERVLDNLLREWLYNNEISVEEVINDLLLLKIKLNKQTPAYLVYLNIYPTNDKASWSEELTYFFLKNISIEYFSRYGQVIIFSKIHTQHYFLIAYEGNEQLIDREGLLRNIQNIQKLFEEKTLYQLSCYLSNKEKVRDLAQIAKKQILAEKNDVKKSSGIIFNETLLTNSTESNQASDELLAIKNYLFAREIEEARKACLKDLSKKASYPDFNAIKLREFFLGYTQVLSVVASAFEISLLDLFNQTKDVNQFFSASVSLENMINYVNQTMDFLSIQLNRMSNEASVVHEIKEYIENNLDQDIKRADISLQVHFSPDYVSRIFKQETGESLKEFITKSKMNEAKNLLRSTTLPIGIISAKVGYTNFAYFSNLYKKFWQVSPSEERL